MFSDLRLRTVSHELFPLKPAPRPNLPSTRRTWRPLAPFLWPERSPNRIPFELASLNPYAATRPFAGAALADEAQASPIRASRRMASAARGAPAARLELLVGGIDRLLGGPRACAPGQAGGACELPPLGTGAARRHAARRAPGMSTAAGQPLCGSAMFCENFVKSAEAAKIGLPGRTGTASVTPGRSRGRPSSPPNRFRQVRARIDCRRVTGAPLESKGAYDPGSARMTWGGSRSTKIPTLPRVHG